MEKKLMNRKTYKTIKKYDKQEMESFISNIYSSGFQDGAKTGQQADFKIELVRLLEDIKGIGPKTKDKILQAYKER